MHQHEKKQRQGLIFAVVSAMIWGVTPLYWKYLESIDSLILMFYRLILAFVFVLLICLIKYKPKEIIAPLKNKKAALLFFVSGLIIATNWSMFIWAVNAGFMIQTSIGYYIEPLFVAVMGMIIFHEKLNKFKVTAIALALLGVSVMVFSYGQVPTIALLLASSFSIYAALKRGLRAPALLALLYETGLVVPMALPILIYLESTGQGVLATVDITHLVVLGFAGIITAIPLLLFGLAANRISMITLGLTEYISPSLTLVFGIFMFNEPFDMIKFMGFVIIWIGLVIFTVGEVKSFPSGGEGVERL